ncbi:hypothetical protein HDU67_008095 [Dinochytrium kinnereticum]|nr:hypothetical protein HDU67_008095 [Dinochytrium kinnereticum]
MVLGWRLPLWSGVTAQLDSNLGKDDCDAVDEMETDHLLPHNTSTTSWSLISRCYISTIGFLLLSLSAATLPTVVHSEKILIGNPPPLANSTWSWSPYLQAFVVVGGSYPAILNTTSESTSGSSNATSSDRQISEGSDGGVLFVATNHAVDPPKLAWYRETDLVAPQTVGLIGHSAHVISDDKILIVFGASVGKTAVTEDSEHAAHHIGILDLRFNTYTALETTGSVPSPRYHHAAAYDPATNRAFVFGGAVIPNMILSTGIAPGMEEINASNLASPDDGVDDIFKRPSPSVKPVVKKPSTTIKPTTPYKKTAASKHVATPSPLKSSPKPKKLPVSSTRYAAAIPALPTTTKTFVGGTAGPATSLQNLVGSKKAKPTTPLKASKAAGKRPTTTVAAKKSQPSVKVGVKVSTVTKAVGGTTTTVTVTSTFTVTVFPVATPGVSKPVSMLYAVDTDVHVLDLNSNEWTVVPGNSNDFWNPDGIVNMAYEFFVDAFVICFGRDRRGVGKLNALGSSPTNRCSVFNTTALAYVPCPLYPGSSDPPNPREGARLTTDISKQRIYLFGGWDPSSGLHPDNVWYLDASVLPQLLWRPIPTSDALITPFQSRKRTEYLKNLNKALAQNLALAKSVMGPKGAQFDPERTLKLANLEGSVQPVMEVATDDDDREVGSMAVRVAEGIGSSVRKGFASLMERRHDGLRKRQVDLPILPDLPTEGPSESSSDPFAGINLPQDAAPSDPVPTLIEPLENAAPGVSEPMITPAAAPLEAPGAPINVTVPRRRRPLFPQSSTSTPAEPAAEVEAEVPEVQIEGVDVEVSEVEPAAEEAEVPVAYEEAPPEIETSVVTITPAPVGRAYPAAVTVDGVVVVWGGELFPSSPTQSRAFIPQPLSFLSSENPPGTSNETEFTIINNMGVSARWHVLTVDDDNTGTWLDGWVPGMKLGTLESDFRLVPGNRNGTGPGPTGNASDTSEKGGGSSSVPTLSFLGSPAMDIAVGVVVIGLVSGLVIVGSVTAVRRNRRGKAVASSDGNGKKFRKEGGIRAVFRGFPRQIRKRIVSGARESGQPLSGSKPEPRTKAGLWLKARDGKTFKPSSRSQLQMVMPSYDVDTSPAILSPASSSVSSPRAARSPLISPNSFSTNDETTLATSQAPSIISSNNYTYQDSSETLYTEASPGPQPPNPVILSTRRSPSQASITSKSPSEASSYQPGKEPPPLRRQSMMDYVLSRSNTTSSKGSRGRLPQGTPSMRSPSQNSNAATAWNEWQEAWENAYSGAGPPSDVVEEGEAGFATDDAAFASWAYGHAAGFRVAATMSEETRQSLISRASLSRSSGQFSNPSASLGRSGTPPPIYGSITSTKSPSIRSSIFKPPSHPPHLLPISNPSTAAHPLAPPETPTADDAEFDRWAWGEAAAILASGRPGTPADLEAMGIVLGSPRQSIQRTGTPHSRPGSAGGTLPQPLSARSSVPEFLAKATWWAQHNQQQQQTYSSDVEYVAGDDMDAFFAGADALIPDDSCDDSGFHAWAFGFAAGLAAGAQALSEGSSVGGSLARIPTTTTRSSGMSTRMRTWGPRQSVSSVSTLSSKGGSSSGSTSLRRFGGLGRVSPMTSPSPPPKPAHLRARASFLLHATSPSLTMPAVPKFQIHPAGPEVSAMAYGIWRLADGEPETRTPEVVLDRIRRCLSLGITTFDAADIYGGGEGHVCEKLFGEALALDPTLRPHMQIISKTGIRCLGVSVKHYDLTQEYIVAQVKASVEAMKVGHLDILLIHRPSPMMNPEVVAEAFRSLKAAGLVKHFGVSNFTTSQMELLQSRLEFPLVTNQIELHPLRLEPLHDGTLDHLLRHRAKPMAWSPLAGGRLFSESAATNDPAVARVQSTLKTIAESLGEEVTVDQVAYAWIMAHPSQPIPVLGTNNIARIEAAVGAFALKLSLEQWFSIWEAYAGKEVP